MAQFVRALEGVAARQLVEQLSRLLDIGHGVIWLLVAEQADHARLTGMSGHPMMRQEAQKNPLPEPCFDIV
jgi:hypothetical protein